MKKVYIHTNQILRDRRKELRNNSTKEEIILWLHLKQKKLGYKFQRQHSIGTYITDFYCAEKRLIIELDGSQHLDNGEYDRERTAYFEELNMKVLRFWNNEINKNLEGVLEIIRGVVNK